MKKTAEVDPDFTEVTDPHLVCSLLKQYLRDLPEPIIPFSLYDQFMELADTFGCFFYFYYYFI